MDWTLIGWLLAILVAMLQVPDGLFTYYVVRAGGQELNPLVLYSFRLLGLGKGLIFWKLLAGSLAFVLAYLQPNFKEATYVLAGLAVVYFAVVIWNLRLFLKLFKF